jgi:hypothetical protein
MPKLQRTKQELADAQRRWRARADGSGTVHVSDLDTATLDAIAIWLYEEFPHDPPNGIENPWIFPSRPAAVRWLCQRWRDENPEKVELFPRLAKIRRKLSDFWRAEASWRRATSGTLAERPAPPWGRMFR